MGIKKGANALWYSELSLYQLGSRHTVFIPRWTARPCILYQVCATRGEGSVVGGAFCDWGYYCALPTFKDLGSLEGNFKHLDKYTGNVGVKGFEDLREKPIRAIQDVAG